MPNMDKRFRDRGKRNNYYEHDDREFAPSFSERRVSFKGPQRFSQDKAKSYRKLRQAFLLNGDDVDMGGSSRSLPPRMNTRGKRLARVNNGPNPYARRILQESGLSWYKVQVYTKVRQDKEYVFRVLNGYIKPLSFVPYYVTTSNANINFFVDDFAIADQLQKADYKITIVDGQKLQINVRPNMPFIEIDEKLRQKLQVVMSRRYQVATQALDLRKFYADAELVAENIFIPLDRPNVLQTVVQIITESIPDIRALDLSDNKLTSLHVLKTLVKKTPLLRVLHIANNKIKALMVFEVLKGLPLEDLNIDGNPVCDRFKDQATYIREVRKWFPKVVTLDGANLPPPIVFDVEDSSCLVPSKGSFMCNVNGGNVVQQFLEQYYMIFDNEYRQPLADAYHENAQFSMMCTPGLTSYISESRNLLVVQNLEKRQRLLRQGRSSIISFLTEFTKTQHDPTSFVVDLVLYTPQIIQLSVSGVYREAFTSRKLPIRSFSRVFIIVPVGAGFCIINDMLSCTNATPEQARKAFKAQTAPTPQTPIASPVSATVVSPPAAVISPAATIVSPPSAAIISPTAVVSPTIETQQQMVSTLSIQTGMNLAWSEKCLNETSWNFENALYVFSELNKQGKVPAEAFIK